MKPPQFVKLIGDSWCIAGDDSITVEIEAKGKLAWDDTFQKIVSQLQHRDRRGSVLDVGAYIGDSTRWFLAHGFHTIAFEPQPDAFLCLSRNCPEAALFNFPVGNGEKVLLPWQSIGNLGARQLKKSEDDAEGLPTIRIDDLEIEEVACIKIDVEGCEPNVLYGAVKTINRCEPIVVCEINPQALQAQGFTESDITSFFAGWKSEEIFRYYDQNWDIMFYK